MTERIKVAYVSHFPHMRMGGQKSMAHLIEFLDKGKFEPFCIVPKFGELSEYLENFGCKCYEIPLFSLKPRHFNDIRKSYSLIKRFLVEKNIHIISPDRDADAFLCGMAKRKSRSIMIWHVRVNDGNNKDWINSRLADGIIGVSSAAGKRFSDKKSITEKYRTIFNGVDTQKFIPAEDKKNVREKLGMPHDKFILLFAGQIKIGKGIIDLTEAVKLLKNKFNPEKLPAVYYVGTTANKPVLEKVENMIKDLGLNEIITMTGHKKNISEYMQASDALILPSHEGVEGLPRVMYEAMACGAAVIGSDTSGVREAVTDNSGLLVREKSPEDIAKTIALLMEDAEVLNKLQLNGRKRAVEVFDIRKSAREIENFYLDRINNKALSRN